MPTIQHSLLGNSELHEPKGISGASADEVYIANGVGSGTWQKIVTSGWENVQHDGASQSLSSGVRTKVLNDAAGSLTVDAYNLPNATGSVWDSTNNQFNWDTAGLEVGDMVNIRFDFEFTVDTNNDGFLLEMDFAVGGSFPFTLPLDERNIDQAGTQQINRYISFYIGSADVLNNPAEVYVTANSSGDSIDINGWYVRLEPRNPRFS